MMFTTQSTNSMSLNGPSVIFSVIWFSIYSVLWIRSTVPAQTISVLKFHDEAQTPILKINIEIGKPCRSILVYQKNACIVFLLYLDDVRNAFQKNWGLFI